VSELSVQSFGAKLPTAPRSAPEDSCGPAIDAMGRIDVVVNNAGYFEKGY
jgi:NAD(P)-dependent dehydrogenase (short-subunit alcohol dehydrogenase family)